MGKTRKHYATWQEASKAAINLGVTSQRTYLNERKADSKLPFAPQSMYYDFPGWKIFLGGKKKEKYPSWQLAGEAARRIGILSSLEYQQKYKQDPKLPSNPQSASVYGRFPGWKKFLGNE